MKKRKQGHPVRSLLPGKWTVSVSELLLRSWKVPYLALTAIFFQELHQAVWTYYHHRPSASGLDLFLQMTDRNRIRFSDSTGLLTPLKFLAPNWTTLWTSTSQSRLGWGTSRMSMTTARRESKSTSCVMLMEKVSTTAWSLTSSLMIFFCLAKIKWDS